MPGSWVPSCTSTKRHRKFAYLREELIHESCVVNGDLHLFGIVILCQLLLWEAKGGR